MKKILTATFKIPKKKIKNANTPMNYIVAANKSAWIRSYAEKIWEEATKEQFNITAVEPEINEVEIDEETAATMDRIKELETELDNANTLLKQHSENNLDYKDAKKKYRLKATPEEEKLKLTEIIENYEETLENLKALKQRRTLTLRNFKKIQDKEIKKSIRKNKEKNRRLYIEEKLKINKFQQLFKTCHILITVNNITNRNFDSPNFYPTVKNIIDGGTDTGVLWEDDNNNIIKSMTFLAGTNIDRDNYIIDITVYKDFNDLMGDYNG